MQKVIGYIIDHECNNRCPYPVGNKYIGSKGCASCNYFMKDNTSKVTNRISKVEVICSYSHTFMLTIEKAEPLEDKKNA